MSARTPTYISAVEHLVKEYVKSVYGVSLETLVESYSKGSKQEEIIKTPKQAVKEDEEMTLTNAFLKMSEKKAVKSKCIHPIAKGEKKGQPCGTSVSEESKSGKYCKKHLAQEDKAESSSTPKTVEKKTVSKKTATSEPLNKFTKDELKEKIEKRTTEIEVRRNKFGNWEHQGSGILIDRDTRKAYGKQQSNGSIGPLTSEDIELCKSIGFKYVLPDNISSNDNEEMDEEEDEDDDLDIDEDIDDEDME
jgi:hypothetical protein